MGSFGDYVWNYRERLKSPDLECSVRRLAVRAAPSCELIAVHHALVMKCFLKIGYQVEESLKISICTVGKNGSLLGSCNIYCTLNAKDILTNLLQWAKFNAWSRARYFIFLKKL
jgi:hypothetical protein